MFPERTWIWSPAAFSFFLTAMFAYWQLRYAAEYRLSPGAFGLLIHIPIIVWFLCGVLNRHQTEIDRLTAEVRWLTDAAKNKNSK